MKKLSRRIKKEPKVTSPPAGYLIYLNRILFKLKNSLRFGKRITRGSINGWHKQIGLKCMQIYAVLINFTRLASESARGRRQHLL